VPGAGGELGASAHTVWIGDGGNFPGQVHTRRALERYLESLRAIYRALPPGCRLFIEHKLYEPAFYATVLNDWGTSYYCARELGDRAFSLVDLGHHAPNVNIEMIVARLIQFGKLGGFHFNDSKYGDDDLDTGPSSRSSCSSCSTSWWTPRSPACRASTRPTCSTSRTT
jgi:L-rhamnose isomerase / sugar isomerase